MNRPTLRSVPQMKMNAYENVYKFVKYAAKEIILTNFSYDQLLSLFAKKK